MYKRSEKVSEAIHELVSKLLIKGLKDPRVGFVTITGVKVTDDLRQSTIYFTVIGSDAEKKATEQGLNSARGYIRTEIGKELRLRHVPEVAFKYDTAIEYGQRIEGILKQLNETEEG